ncbi:hypothetical protein UCRPC4_g03908 [Phaeomoniella chlamydospora]|uniref:Chalcone isomerase domain-containing protein n=1 Tax=Phaeomoniella chlamydospora TaxID=158046 RepID=A0A0G2EFF7_PHACM|nr:hypothetical protein UCRPC4_g03908 [Phaeomoniella chlamydospora]
MKLYTFLILATGAAMVITVKSDLFPIPPEKPGASSGTVRLDAPPLELAVQSSEVQTGTSTIPTFPRYISLPSQDVGAPTGALPAGTAPGPGTTGQEGLEEYQLLGLGIRTVSFLGIQVYVVGLYVALPDIATLQERLIRTVDPVATTLVPAERSKLYDLLHDPSKSEEIWSSIIKSGNIRTAIRIVPTRNTDFGHLRDGWLRGITGKTQIANANGSTEFLDDAFGQSVSEFKTIFGGTNKGKVPKGETLLLLRNKKGELQAYHEEIKTLKSKSSDTPSDQLPPPPPSQKQTKKTKIQRSFLGEVKDERISRLLLLLYLGGKNVSSEGARDSVVDGCLELVERPVGTVEAQVV